jgi:OHCU decarboxylase
MSLFVVDGVSKTFGSGRSGHRALSDVSFTVRRQQALGIVGESGSGKSTLARCLVGLVRPDSGRITYDGIDVQKLSRVARRRVRSEVQLILQDPYASLNPRMTAEDLITEGLIVHKLAATASARRDRAVEMLELVGMGAADLTRYPRSFSGGQRQRLAIARALAVAPRVLICDEPVSALDVSVQAQVINVLAEARQRLGLTLVFIAHDLAVVRHLCPQVIVINAGRIVEAGDTPDVFAQPTDPYTKALLDAAPIPDPIAARARRRWLVGTDPAIGSLAAFNSVPAESIERALLSCHPSPRWARAMTGQRPFADIASLTDAAYALAVAQPEDDIVKIASRHASIGLRERETDEVAARWSEVEQATALQSGADVLERIQDADDEHRRRFGYVFIVCATGLSGTEIYQQLQERLTNSPAQELAVTRAQLGEIAALRVARLVDADEAVPADAGVEDLRSLS